jgi:uncharacterized membrane protein YczE
MSVLGVAICAFSVGIFKFAALGVDPFQTFMSGLDATVPIRFGTLYIIVSVVLLVFALVFDRSKIGIATVINLLFFGYIAEFTQNWLLGLFPDATFVFRVGALLIAIVVLCLASSLYFTADLGVSVYDAVSLVASERQSKVPFAMCRVISDFVCVAMGTTMLALSDLGKAGVIANVGVGTIVTAFFMGPLITYFNVHVAQPMLHGKKKA